jgi:hypothetical protein
MKTFILIFVLFFPVAAHAETIFVVSDSTWNFVHDVAIASPPEGFTILETGSEGDYDGKGLGYWLEGAGWDLIENSPPFDILWVYNGLFINDFLCWPAAEDCSGFGHFEKYDDMDDYLASWLLFYQKVYAKDPSIEIIHMSPYVFRTTKVGRPPSDFVTCGSGTFTPIYEPVCTTRAECLSSLNGMIAGVWELLNTANANLNYLYYHDPLSELSAFAEPDVWFDYYIPYNGPFFDDCIHMPAERYLQYYGRFLSSWFVNYMNPNVTIINTTIQNTTIK